MGSRKWRFASKILAVVLLVAVFGAVSAWAQTTLTLSGGTLTANLGPWGGTGYVYPLTFDVTAPGGIDIIFYDVDCSLLQYDNESWWEDALKGVGEVGVTAGTAITSIDPPNDAVWSNIQNQNTNSSTDWKGNFVSTLGTDETPFTSDDTRSWLFQSWYRPSTGGKTGHPSYGDPAYNSESYETPNPRFLYAPTHSPDYYCTFDLRLKITYDGGNNYTVQRWVRMHNCASVEEGCPYCTCGVYNHASNNCGPDDAWRQFENGAGEYTFPITNIDLTAVHPFIGIGNFPVPAPHTLTWGNVVVTGTPTPQTEVWVDDNWDGLPNGAEVALPGGGTGYIGYDAFSKIQDGIDAVAGSTVNVAAGEYPEVLTIDKSLTLKGDPSGDRPKIVFSDTNEDGITVTGDNVTFDNLWLYREGHSYYRAIIAVPKGGSWPNYTIGTRGLMVQNCLIEGGRYGMYVSVEDMTVQNCTFKEPYRDGIVTAGIAGTTTIMGNHFIGIGGTKQAIYMTTGPGKPYDSGTLNISYNTHTGGGHFFLVDYWGWDEVNPVDLQITHNSIDQIGNRKGVVFYAAYAQDPQGFPKFNSVTIRDNIFSNCGPAVYVDYQDWGGAPPTDNRTIPSSGQIVVDNNLTHNVTAGANDTMDAAGAYGYYNVDGMTPSGASLAMFDLSGNIVGNPLYDDPNHQGICFGYWALKCGSPAYETASDGTNIGAWQGELICAIEVNIDIKPGNDTNSVNPRSMGSIPVAILSTDEFDSPDLVNCDTLTFGRTGDENSLARRGGKHEGPHCSVEDVNNDGLPDLVCHFKTQETGFESGDTEGILKGQTLDGIPIEGRDSVRIVPSNKPHAVPGELKVVAYPNPIRDVHTATFQVMGTMAAEVEEIRVQIYDLSGHLVWEDAALGSELDWHTDSLSGDYLANGIYLYRVQVRIGGSWINQDIGKIAVLR